MSEYKYVAFISYQRADEEWAKWFHHQLEHYHLPADIADRSEILHHDVQPAKELRPMFLDEEELAGGNLAEVIRIALNDSRYLIVLCSPNSAKSEWVNQEVKTFIEDGRINYVVPVIIDGIPYSEDLETECLVPALRELKRTDNERLGINAKAGREMASVKVVSQLLGISFDSLWNRYEREKELERLRLIEEKRKLQRLESRYLSEKGLDAIAAGNSTLARRIALAALPVDIYDPEDRPFVGEAADMLIQAYKHNNTIYSQKSHSVRWAGFGVKGNLFATCSFGIKGIQLWDPSLGIPVKHIPCDSTFNSLSISSDGNVIAGGGYHAIYIFNLKDDNVKSIPLDEEEFMMTFLPQVTLSPCGQYVACVSNDEEESHIVLFDVETGKDIRRLVGHTDRINCVAFHPQGQCMISGSSDHTIRIWNVETGECLDILEIKSSVRSVSYNSDGTKLLAALAAKVVLLWHIGSGEKPKVFRGHTAQVCKVLFNTDETKLISTSNDTTVRLWDVETGEGEIIVSHNNRVTSASLSSDHRYLVSIDGSAMRITDFKGNGSNNIISRTR